MGVKQWTRNALRRTNKNKRKKRRGINEQGDEKNEGRKHRGHEWLVVLRKRESERRKKEHCFKVLKEDNRGQRRWTPKVGNYDIERHKRQSRKPER